MWEVGAIIDPIRSDAIDPMPRDTVLVGDARTGTARALRRQIYFTEPGSGRRTHRNITGHIGGSSGSVDRIVSPIRSFALPTVSARLDKISSIRTGHELGLPRYRSTARPPQPRTHGRGSNSHVVAHLDFESSLRSGSGHGNAHVGPYTVSLLTLLV